MEIMHSEAEMNKKVTTLLTGEISSAIELLVQTRDICGVPSGNQYIFANQGTGHLACLQVLLLAATQAGCEQPALVTVARLNKYLATVFQVNIRLIFFVDFICM